MGMFRLLNGLENKIELNTDTKRSLIKKYIPTVSNKSVFTKIKLCKLKDKNTIKNLKDNFIVPNYYYDASNIIENPEINKFIWGNKKKGSYSIRLIIPKSSRNIYMSDLNFINKPSIYNNSTNLRMNLDDTNDGASILTSAVTLKGHILIDVIEELKSPIILDSINIYFKCFITEIIMQTDNELNESKYPTSVAFQIFDKRTLLRMLPIQSLHINLLEMIPNGIKLQEIGKIELPFTFIIYPNKFPAQLNTVWGKTFYRVECQIMKKDLQKNYKEWLILSRKIQYHRVLSNEYDMALLKDAVFYRGICNKLNVEYQICLDSRIIEINSHFNICIELLLQKKYPLDTITVFLIQNVAIPFGRSSSLNYMDSSNTDDDNNTKTGCHIFKIEKRLYSGQTTNSGIKSKDRLYQTIENSEENEDIQIISINDLRITNYNELIKANTLVHPFYCESSTQNPNMARIKISHFLSIRFEFKMEGKKRSPRIFHRIPICLIDKLILDSMNMPSYDKI
ncbi:similar to Saccharomyces cerevisiae YBR250W SPO23 Protein of unknown function [Maudiozyma saulgeensis]|uniref:Arrestin C-terminal-like domain-containing protein n=1 Tax=Maudiozyma saulgeensis TaxID=1789683 RepID=A0A1X7RB04_9SACH|nr:similar to Saccharomyces cerevisiae YBR250W SPO23 Protein of unknown function [Kazachstania saulgeensis]